MTTNWIEALDGALAEESAFRAHVLRAAGRDDEDFLYALHRDAMGEYVDATWGWNEEWQRAHFAAHFAPARNAIVVRTGAASRDVGRISLTHHWRMVFLRDIELVDDERNRGLGTALVNAVLSLARRSARHVELLVLRRNPARRLYARLGFRVIGDDGARLRMRAD